MKVNTAFWVRCTDGSVKPDNTCIYQPKTHFKGGEIQWFDDRQLRKKKKNDKS